MPAERNSRTRIKADMPTEAKKSKLAVKEEKVVKTSKTESTKNKASVNMRESQPSTKRVATEVAGGSSKKLALAVLSKVAPSSTREDCTSSDSDSSESDSSTDEDAKTTRAVVERGAITKSYKKSKPGTLTGDARNGRLPSRNDADMLSLPSIHRRAPAVQLNLPSVSSHTSTVTARPSPVFMRFTRSQQSPELPLLAVKPISLDECRAVLRRIFKIPIDFTADPCFMYQDTAVQIADETVWQMVGNNTRVWVASRPIASTDPALVGNYDMKVFVKTLSEFSSATE